MNKPFKSYNGGKNGNGTFQTIINQIPKCDIFVEAFGGSLGITTNLQLPGLAVVNDLNPAVVVKYNYLSCTKGIVVRNDCYRSIIKEFDVLKNVVFYLDPPYMFSTRRSKKRIYGNFEWSDEQHEKFLELAVTVKNNCLISHYPCELYDTRLANWRKIYFKSATRQGMRTECIYMNFDEPSELQDYRYLGHDKTKRQQLKRIVQRQIAKFERMTAQERNAIMTALVAKYNYPSVEFLPPQ